MIVIKVLLEPWFILRKVEVFGGKDIAEIILWGNYISEWHQLPVFLIFIEFWSEGHSQLDLLWINAINMG